MGVGQELGRGRAERGGDLGEADQRDVAVAGLELGEEPLAHAAALAQLAARPAEAIAHRADARPDGGQQFIATHD
jgi:hypothetical protein